MARDTAMSTEGGSEDDPDGCKNAKGEGKAARQPMLSYGRGGVAACKRGRERER